MIRNEWYDPRINNYIQPPPTLPRWLFYQNFGKVDDWGVGDAELLRQEREEYVRIQNEDLEDLIRRVDNYRDYEDPDLRDMFRRTNDTLN